MSLEVNDANTALPNIVAAQFRHPEAGDFVAREFAHKPRILLLYGSIRERSYSRFA